MRKLSEFERKELRKKMAEQDHQRRDKRTGEKFTPTTYSDQIEVIWHPKEFTPENSCQLLMFDGR